MHAPHSDLFDRLTFHVRRLRPPICPPPCLACNQVICLISPSPGLHSPPPLLSHLISTRSFFAPSLRPPPSRARHHCCSGLNASWQRERAAAGLLPWLYHLPRAFCRHPGMYPCTISCTHVSSQLRLALCCRCTLFFRPPTSGPHHLKIVVNQCIYTPYSTCDRSPHWPFLWLTWGLQPQCPACPLCGFIV